MEEKDLEKVKELQQKQEMYRHSMSHVLAKAIKSIWGDVKLAIGPAIDNGFYYDIDMEHSITPEDFGKIEDKMREIICNNEDFVRFELSREEALEKFKDNPYKVELITELPEGELITMYRTGDDFYDLCRGPHVENTKFLRGFAYKINRVSGAYWRGSEKNKMLQRVYVYGFLDKNDLKAYIHQMEEALKRDHRKLGKELQLFFISDYSKGMPTYMPKGLTLKNELIKYWREVHQKAGYIEIETPMAMNRELWETSGHWDHYKDNMYTFKCEDDTFAIKPMNCPGGMLYYMQNIHSYKEFPLRVGELGKVHRHESSGTLNGLLRVRCFTQDDAHIFMLPNQIESEVANVISLVDEVYKNFGLTYTVELSTMPESHIGEIEEWQMAETALANALTKLGLEYKINAGDGAFYGPKIDIHVKDCIGREWQCGTIQLDMQLPKRFNLTYIDADGSEKEPIMIHRVIYGSLERMMSILIENFAGAFPTWLSPNQVKVITVSEKNNEYAVKVAESLIACGLRVETNLDNESVGKKIRNAVLEKTPYILVLGDKEMAEGTVAVRKRGSQETITMSIDEFKAEILNNIATKSLTV
ncbi:MAG: threonine--tRNA ligase [Clostridia bacterium]|nr:threonine--tRNA ligase [Clostridia bacterium]